MGKKIERGMEGGISSAASFPPAGVDLECPPHGTHARTRTRLFVLPRRCASGLTSAGASSRPRCGEPRWRFRRTPQAMRLFARGFGPSRRAPFLLSRLGFRFSQISPPASLPPRFFRQVDVRTLVFSLGEDLAAEVRPSFPIPGPRRRIRAPAPPKISLPHGLVFSVLRRSCSLSFF